MWVCGALTVVVIVFCCGAELCSLVVYGGSKVLF
jgi:hypothetical protein